MSVESVRIFNYIKSEYLTVIIAKSEKQLIDTLERGQ